MSVYNVAGNKINSAYDVDGQTAQNLYDYHGNELVISVDYTNYTIGAYCSLSLSNMQGFAIYDGTIFQVRTPSGGGVLCTVNAQSQSIITNNISATVDHGDSVSFSNEVSEGESYPLLYVTADSNPAKVYINRVTLSSSALVKTLSFPLDKTGYYAAHAYDAVNKIMYMVGYSEMDYLTDDGGNNKTVISKWDMENLTDNGDGTFTPQYLATVERAFIYCMQGQQYQDQMIWIASGYVGSVNSYVYAINPTSGAVLYTVDLNTTTEVEGVSFISDTEMIVGLAGGTYKKVTFASAS